MTRGMTVWSGPASATGAVLSPLARTVIVTVSECVNGSWSLTVNVKTMSVSVLTVGALNDGVAVVPAARLTAGPLVFAHE